MKARKVTERLVTYNESPSTQEMKGNDKIVFVFVSFSTCGLIYYSWLVHLPLR